MPRDNNIVSFPQPLDARLQTVVEAHYAGNDAEALKQCLSLIDAGVSEAYAFAGAFYERGGAGVAPDFSKARFYYEKSVDELGAVESYLGLARIYLHGLGVERDLCMSWSLYSKVARESNNPVANLMLGTMYENGLCVDKDYDKAKEFYRRAWDKGQILGLTHLGLLEQRTGNYLRGMFYRLRAGYEAFRTASKEPHDSSLRAS